MKALTICQPYAHLIAAGKKRVENRTWSTAHRGLIYIHAGKSREWLDIEGDRDAEYDIPLKSMAFGAVVAIADLVACVHINSVRAGTYDRQFPWLQKHEHTSGPWCWIVDHVNPIGPWPYTGAQGLFEINDDKLDEIATRVINQGSKR